MNGYAALGHRQTILGEETSSDTGGIISNIFDMVKQGTQSVVAAKAQKDAANKAAGDSAAALNAAISADNVARDAIAKALISAALSQPSASADQAAMTLALQTEDMAAVGLSSENQKKRADAALDALKKATANWQTASKDTTSAKIASFSVQAAQQVYGKTQNMMLQQAAQVPGGVVQHQQEMAKVPSQSWFTRPVVGPVPGWGVLAGLGAIGTAVAVALKGRR